MAATATLQPQLDTIAAGAAPWIESTLSPPELITLESQWAADRESPYPVPAVGSVAPFFSLHDSNGSTVTLQQLVDSGKHTVLLWYRGAWCPFCQATVKAYNARVDDFAAANAQVVAITPTLPEHTAKTVAEFGLRYTVLSDVGNEVARQYGTLNQLSEDLRGVYLKLGAPLSSIYGDTATHLPHPGVFVVEAKTGTLAFSRVEKDYRIRVEPDELLSVLKQL